MKQGIKVLGWTVTIVTLLVFTFLIMSVYSLVQTIVFEQGIRMGESSFEVSEDRIVLSTPFSINNTSYFEISDLRIVSILKDSKGTNITVATTNFGRIPSGSKDFKRHNLSMSINDILTKNLTYLLFNDGEFLMDNILEMKYANIIGFKVAISNISMPWGAPFSNFQLGAPSAPQMISENPRVFSVDIPVRFENHSPFSIHGTMFVNVYNQDEALLGSGNRTLNVVNNSIYSDKIRVEVSWESLQNYTGRGYIEVRFEMSRFSFELPRVTYG